MDGCYFCPTLYLQATVSRQKYRLTFSQLSASPIMGTHEHINGGPFQLLLALNNLIKRRLLGVVTSCRGFAMNYVSLVIKGSQALESAPSGIGRNYAIHDVHEISIKCTGDPGILMVKCRSTHSGALGSIPSVNSRTYPYIHCIVCTLMCTCHSHKLRVKYSGRKRVMFGWCLLSGVLSHAESEVADALSRDRMFSRVWEVFWHDIDIWQRLHSRGVLITFNVSASSIVIPYDIWTFLIAQKQRPNLI
jgi:hypothetical protein